MRVHVVVAVVALVVAAAQPSPDDIEVRCGDLVTQDVTLRADLSCDKGLELAPGVTLDLGGHSLSGPWTHAGVAVLGPLAGHATVRNGVIGNWSLGVAADRGGSLHLEDLVIGGVGVAVEQAGGPLTVAGAQVSGTDVAIRCAGACDVERSSFEGSLLQPGLDCRGGGPCTVRSSTFRELEGAALNITSITDSVVRDCSSGVGLTASGPAHAARNHFELVGGALGVAAPGSTVVDNVFHANEYALTVADATSGPPVEVVGNVFTQNVVALESTSRFLHLARNVATGSTQAGIAAPHATQTDWNVGVEPAP